MFVFSRVKYRVLIVRHMIYDHHCLWSCPPELHSMSLLFDISSMTFFFYVCVFQISMVCPCCSTFNLWSPLLTFMCSGDYMTYLMFGVSSLVIAIHACVFQRSNMVSLMFDISPMAIIIYACVYQRYIPCPLCLTYHLRLLLFLYKTSRHTNRVFNFWHIIYDHGS